MLINHSGVIVYSVSQNIDPRSFVIIDSFPQLMGILKPIFHVISTRITDHHAV